MHRLNFTNINSILTTGLLLLQVILVTLIIVRINSLAENLAKLSSQSAKPDEAPLYVQDVSIDDDPIIGNESASVTIIEFSDYQCPFCAQVEPEVKSILAEYPNEVRFVYRDFPLMHSHPDAFKAALAANCANEYGKFWEMHDLLFANQDSFENEKLENLSEKVGIDSESFLQCIESSKYSDEVLNDMQDGQKYQVTATPTFFVNGFRVVGVESLRATVVSLLRNPKGGE